MYYSSPTLMGANPVLSTLVVIACLFLLFSPFVFAFVSAHIADRKGEGYATFFFVGLFLGAFGLAIVAALPDRRIQRSRDLAEGLLACKQLLDAGAITAEDFGQIQADFAVEMADQRHKSIIPELVVGIVTIVIVAIVGAAFGLPFFVSLF